MSLLRASRGLLRSRLTTATPQLARQGTVPRFFASFPEESRLLGQYRFIKEPKTVAIIGCPFSGGQPRAGVDQGPIHLVEAGIIDQISTLGWKVDFEGHHQFEDIAVEHDPPRGIVKRPRLVSKICKSVSEAVGKHIQDGALPLTLGGDHSLAMGTVAGTLSKHPNAVVIWVDAHADINSVSTTPTGNVHGMPAAFLLGLPSTETVPEFSWLTDKTKSSIPRLQANSIVFIGLRDVDPGEKKILKENGITAFSMHEVDKYGIGEVMNRALDAVNPHRDRPIHLTFDVDALDPSVAPSTGTPVRGGLTFREGHYICEAIAETGLLAAFDLVEVNPSLTDDFDVKQTVSVGCSLVRSALGETLL